MKLKRASAYAALIIAAVSTVNADQTRNATADSLNLGSAWVSGTAPGTGDVARWDASSTLASTLAANQTWGGLDISAAAGAVGITGAFALTLDHSTDTNTVLNVGAGDFTWGSAGVGGNFHINGAAGSTSSTAQGATFAGSGLVTISSTGSKNWSSNGTTNGVTQVNFTGTLALRGATIPTIGTLSGNFLALGGGGGAASAIGTTLQTGSFALDTGDETSCGSLVLTHGWSGQFLKLNSLRGTGSIRADWGLSTGTQTRGIELDQAGDTTFSGSILAHSNATQRRNVTFVKKGAGRLTLTGGLGTSGTVAASLNFDLQGGVLQLGDGTTNPVYANASTWDSASTFNLGAGTKLRFMSPSSFSWTHAITSGSGKIEITSDGDPDEGNVTFTANNSAFTGDTDVLAGSLRIGPNLGSGTLTVKSGAELFAGLPTANGVSVVGALVLEGDTQSEFRLGTSNDRIDVTGSLTPPASGTHTVNIAGSASAGGTLKLIDFSGTALSPTEFARFTLGTTPFGAATYQLVNNTADASLDLLVILEDQLWKGSTDGNWNDTVTNWAMAGTPGTPVAYNQDHPSVFDDSATTFAVVVDAAGVYPTSTTFRNAAKAYVLTGGEIAGTGALVKGGEATTTLALPLAHSGGTTVNLGTLVLSGATNTSSGGTIVNGGTLSIGDGAATGDIGSGPVVVGAGGTLRFNRDNSAVLDYKTTAKMRNVSGAGSILIDGGVTLFNYTGTGIGFAEPGSWAGFSGKLIIRGGSEFQTIRQGATAMGTGEVILGDATTSGNLSQTEGSWTWNTNIAVNGPDNRIINRSNANFPRYLKIQGVLSGGGGLTFADATPSMTNNQTGFILTGANTFSGTMTIPAGVPVRVGGIPGDNATEGPDAFGSLGSATVINQGTLTFSRTDAHTVANAISGEGALFVGLSTGTASQVLTYTGNANHTGTTTVRSGSLMVGGGASMGGSSVTVEAAGTLGGSGAIAAPLVATGTIAPGMGIGTLPVAGNTTLSGTLAIEIDGPGCDRLTVTGDLDLTGSTLTVIPAGAGFTAASYVVAECTGTLTGMPTAPAGFSVSTIGNQVILKKSGYDSWKADNAGGQAANLDFDHDGVPNGVEYFMGETGSTFTANPGVANGKVTWKRDPGAVASFMVQISDNLGSWTDIVPPHASIDESVVGQVTFTLPAGAATKFCRLVVTP